MPPSTHRGTRAAVVLLLLLGVVEDLAVLLRPGRALADYYHDEIAANPRYLAEAGLLAWGPLVLGIVVELALAALAVAILVKAWRRREARALALFLAIGGMGLPGGIGIPPGTIEMFDLLAIPIGTAALLHFSMVFPEAIPAGAPGWPPPGVWRRLQPRPLAALTAAACLLIAALGTGELAALVAVAVLLTGAIVGARNMRGSYRRASEEERRRVLWVLNGFYGLAWVLVLAIPGAIAIYTTAFLLARERAETLGDVGFQTVFGAGLLLLPVCLAIGIFRGGAIDPRLAIRKTTIFGAVGALSLTLFMAVEGTASMQLMSMLNLPGNVAPWVAGSSVAVAFGPLRRWVERRTTLLVDRLIPATALAEQEREEAVVVFADICGYTRISATDEAAALTLASLFHASARRVAQQRGGRLVKTLGDGVVLEFAAPEPAAAAAVELRSRFRAAAVAMGLDEPELRCGINRGAVARGRDGDIFGAAVNLASRLEGAAEPGEVLVSEAVAEALHGAPGWVLEPAGERTLRNVPDPVATYRCRPSA